MFFFWGFVFVCCLLLLFSLLFVLCSLLIFACLLLIPVKLLLILYSYNSTEILERIKKPIGVQKTCDKPGFCEPTHSERYCVPANELGVRISKQCPRDFHLADSHGCTCKVFVSCARAYLTKHKKKNIKDFGVFMFKSLLQLLLLCHFKIFSLVLLFVISSSCSLILPLAQQHTAPTAVVTPSRCCGCSRARPTMTTACS